MMRKVVFLGSSIVIAALITMGFSTSKINLENNEKITTGINSVAKLEKQDVAEIQRNINEHLEEISVEEVNIDTLDFKFIFKDDIFLGDSLTEALYEYDFINERSVIAQKGATVDKAIEEVDIIKNLAPKRIYILFGLNDMLNYENISEFMDVYSKLLDKLKEELPESKIYVQSITPARSDIRKEQPLFSEDRNKEANKKLKNLCEEKGINFVNIKNIILNKSELYEPDGLHLAAEFYQIWLNKLVDLEK